MTSKTNVVTIYDKKQDKNIKFYLDERLQARLDRVKVDLKKNDKDCFIALDGNEGSGKSTLALQIGKYVDPTLNLSRVVFTAEEFRAAILKAKLRQCVIFDEAFTGLSSRASLSGVNKTLISLMMQIRQKNLFVIMVLPTFFLLDKYVALFRSRALIHVYECSGRRGYFKVYNQRKKKLLYLLGKATYSYSGAKWAVKTSFKGRFYGAFALGDDEMDKKYRTKKLKALEQTERNPMSAGQVKYREQRNLILYLLRITSKMTYQELSNMIGEYDLEISHVQVRNICANFGDTEKLKKEYINKGKVQEEQIVEEDDIENSEEDMDN